MDFGAQGGTGNFSMDDDGGSSRLQDYIKPKRSFEELEVQLTQELDASVFAKINAL